MCSDHTYVLVAGDLNARTSTLPDFVPSDTFLIDHFGVDSEIQSHFDKYTVLENLGIPLRRTSTDKRTNTHGFKLIESCRNNNVFILNGRVGKDRNVGNNTFREKSIIDYVLASAECFEHLDDFEIIETDCLFSDGHHSLRWSVHTCNKTQNITTDREVDTKNITKPPKWQSQLKDNFVGNIDEVHLDNIKTKLNMYPQTQETIKQITDEITTLFNNAAHTTFPQRHPLKTSTNYVKE